MKLQLKIVKQPAMSKDDDHLVDQTQGIVQKMP